MAWRQPAGTCAVAVTAEGSLTEATATICGIVSKVSVSAGTL